MSEVQPPVFLQGDITAPHPTYNAKPFRRGMMGWVGSEGVARFTGDFDLKVTELNATGVPPTVSVGRGGAYIQGDETLGQGMYFVYNDAAKTINMPARPGSGTRTDIIVARVKDTAEGNTGDTWAIEAIQGTTLPNSAIKLADVLVPSGTTAINVIDVPRQKASIHNVGLKVVETADFVLGSISNSKLKDAGVSDSSFKPEIYRTQPQNNVTIPGAGATVTICTLNVPAPVFSYAALVWAFVDWSCQGTSQLEATLEVDGIPQTGKVTLDISNPMAVRGTTWQVWFVQGMPSGTVPFVLKAHDVDVSTSSIDSQVLAANTTLTVMPFYRDAALSLEP